MPIARSRSMPSRMVAGREISAPRGPRGARAAGAADSIGAATVVMASAEGDGIAAVADGIGAGLVGAAAERQGPGEGAALVGAAGPGVAAGDGRPAYAPIREERS